MDIFERVYYMRAITGVAAGIVAGLVMPFQPSMLDQNLSVGITIGIAIAAYIFSFVVSKMIAKNVPKEKRRKVATDGIVPFMFLLLVSMILVYTALHQSSIPF